MHVRTLLLSLSFTAALHASAPFPTPHPTNGDILLPPGFRAVVFADNLVAGTKINEKSNRLRFLAVAPNGDVYAKTKLGGLFALRDTDGDGRADEIKQFGEGGGSGLLFHGEWLYHSTDKDVYRYKYIPGELVPSSPQEPIVVDLPNQRTHESKTFCFDDQGRLIVETGSPSNSFGGKNDRRLGATGSDATEYLQTFGGFWRYDANTLNQKQTDGVRIGTGHRHVVALAWNPVSNAAFFVMHGRDNLSAVAPQFYNDDDNAELPAEEFHRLNEGQNLGWPYSYWDPIKKARMVSPEYGGDNQKREDPEKYQAPLIAFPAHWAPLQMTFYRANQFPEKYRGGAFIAFHGSWNRAPRPQKGYNIVFVPFDANGQPTGDYEVFADGFTGKETISRSGEARWRPGGVAVGPDGSLYFSDTDKGRIWRVFYTGDMTPVPAALPAEVAATAPAKTESEKPAPTAATAAPVNLKGKKTYDQLCAACHMADGSGVADLQPSLIDSKVVRGDPGVLIRTILEGPAAVLPADRPKYSNMMPGYGSMLKDPAVADLVTYMRQAFGGVSGDITPDQVKAQRAKP